MEKNLGIWVALAATLTCVIYLLSQMRLEMDLAALFVIGLGITALISARSKNQAA